MNLQKKKKPTKKTQLLIVIKCKDVNPGEKVLKSYMAR